MIKKLLLPLTALVLALNLQTAKSQSCNFSIGENISDTTHTHLTTLITCCKYGVKYTIINHGGSLACPISLSINLPDEITLDSTGYAIASSNGAVVSHSFANLSVPYFIITSTTTGGYWNYDDSITFTFTLKTACCMPLTNSGHTFISVDTNRCSDTTTTGITVVAPTLDAQSIYPGSHINIFQNTGDAVDLVFEVKNGGTLPINQFVNTVCPSEAGLTMLGYFFSKTNNTTTDLGRNYCNYYQPSNFVAGSDSIVSADTNVYYSLFGVKYFPVDSFYLHLVYKVVGCNMTSTPDTFILFCSNGTGSASCFPGELISSSVAVFAGIPMVNAYLTQPKYIDSSRANYCNGGDTAVNLGLNFVNKGSDVSGGAKGNGRAEKLKLFFYTTNEIGSMDTSSLKINGYHYAWPAGFVTSVPDIGYTKWKIDFTKWNWACGDPLPFGANSVADLDGDGLLDDLSDSTGQDTIHLTANFQYTTTCPASFSNCGNTVDLIFWGGATFQNECNTLTNDTAGNGDGYAYNVQNGGTAQLNLLSGHDVVAGQTSYFQICPGTNTQAWSDTGYKFICTHPDHRVIVNLPPGYNVDFSDPLITGNMLSNYVSLTSTPCGCHSDSIKPLIKQVTFGCDTNQAIIDFGLLPKCNCNIEYLSYNISCFTIPISLNCNSCTNSSRGWDNITFTLDYFCDTSTCLSCGSEISCASNVAFHHCSGGCDTVGNDFNANPPFTFRRQTLGWLNTPPANYYDNCNNPVLPAYNVDSVASVDSTIRLDRAYPGDEILAAETGSLSRALGNFDTVMFQVNYTDAYWTTGWYAAPNVFVFDSLLSSITVISANHDTAVIKYPNLQHIDQVLGDGKVEMSFRFSADSTADTLLKRMLPPYSLSSRVYLVAKTRPFVSGNTFYHTGAYPVNDLQASFRGTYHSNYDDTDNSCDPWTANFTMLQPGFSLDVFGNGSRGDGYFAACNQLFEELRVESSPALYPNVDFPNEYRPFITEDPNFTLVCPTGYKFDSAYFTMVQDKYNATGTNKFTLNDSLKTYNYRITPATISITGDTLTYNGPNHGCFPVLDCKNFGLGYWNNYQLFSYFTPNCDAPDTTYFKAYTGYTTSVQQSDSFYMNHFNIPSTDQIIRVTPSFSCAVASTENLCTDTVSFTLTLANLSGSVNAPYAWISLEQSDPSNPAVTFISATNTHYYDTYSGSNMFIMLDSINPLQSRTVKVTVRVDTANGYGCVSSLTSYPITIAYGNVCTNSPEITQPDTLKGCQYGSTTFTFDLYPSKLSLNQIDSTFVDTIFCGNSLKYTLEISNSDYNTLYKPTFIANLPSGVGLDSVTFKYPDYLTGAYYRFTSDDNSHTTGNLLWNFSSDALGMTGGLPGFCHAHDSNDVVLANIYLHTNCNFNNSVTPITFSASGISPCGKTIISDTIKDKPVIPSSNCPMVTMSSTNVSCYAQSNGTATATVTDGRTPYTYLWSPSSETTATATGLSVGTYTVSVTDNKGCNLIDSVTITQPTVLTVSASVSANVLCYGGNNGIATSTPSGGTIPYTYSWSPSGQTNANATGLTAGTYTVTVTDNKGCTATASVAITQPTLLTVSGSVTANVTCYGLMNGSDSAFASGGISPYTYSWSPIGGTNATATGLSAGTYTITVTDNNGCTASAINTITQPNVLMVSAIVTANVTCYGFNNGGDSAAVSGGTAPYTYFWSDGNSQTTITAIGLNAGTYTVTVTDKNGCTATAASTITQPTLLSVSASVYANVSCYGLSNGIDSATASGGTSPYTYLWSPSGQTNAKATGLSAGIYTVTVTDNYGCTAMATDTVTQPNLLSVSAIINTNVSCNGLSNGSISATANGGTSPYTYSWSPSGQTNATATGLGAGTYTVTVTDNHGCSATASATITQPTLLSVGNSVITNVTCYGLSNGKDSATATGGTSPYTYSWSPSGQTSATATGLSAGTYTITVTDNHGCTATATGTITQPVILSVTDSVLANVTCNGLSNGSDSATASGGTSPYTYSWSPSGQTAATATGLSAGAYTVTVTDNNGCTATVTGTITQPAILSVTDSVLASVTCYGLSNGSDSATASGGTAPYIYSWSPSGGTNATATGLSAGTYTVTVTDNHGCTATATGTITQPVILSVTDSILANVTCYGLSNGSDSATANGGTSPYTYSWSPSGGTNATATGLSAGTYTVTVTDNNGCTATAAGTITQPAILSATDSVLTNVTCFGLSNGVDSAMATGGTSPYTYSWSPSGETSATVTGLSAGTYTVTVTDNNGCTATASATITQPALLNVTDSVIANVNCNGVSSGIDSATVSGGTLPYTYSWSPAGGTNATATDLSAGTYTITVTDNHGCTATATATITQPTPIIDTAFVLSEISCNGGTNGSTYVTVSGGVSSYTYNWSPGSITSDTITNLSAGTYTITITDSNGCIATNTVTLTQPLAIGDSIKVDSNISCNGGSNGDVTVYAYGGISPYTYLWNPAGQTTTTITGLAAGTYTLTITDNNGCTKMDSVTITQPQPLQDIMNIISNINCNSGTLASASTTVSGGTAPYTYLWSPTSQTGDTATGLSAGTYTVAITDNNGCSLIDSIAIQSLFLNLKDDTISCGTSSGDATIIGIGGTPPYTYLWSNGQTTQSIGGLSAGTYSVIVTDSLGCQATDSLTVTGCPKCWLSKKYDLVINDSSASSIHAGPTTYSCMNILIIGTYIVDEDVTIQNCNVEFAPHAMINVINNKTLTLSNGLSCTGFACPHLHAACDTTWRGIFINPGSTVNVFKQAFIEDADSAIVSINSPSAQGLYNIANSTFNKNYKSIVVETCPAFFKGIATSCLFTCRSLSGITPCQYINNFNSAPDTTLLPPYNLPYSYMGMDIDTVRFIGIEYNIFDNLQYGISTHASSLSSFDNLFQNIGFTAGYGAGIVDSGMYDHLNKEFLMADSNKFYGCYNGILATDWFTFVTCQTDTIIDSVNSPGVYGVYVSDMGYPYPNPLNVQENVITNFNTGVEANMNQYISANINYNNISENICSAFPWKGIAINENSTSPCTYVVDDNNISSGYYGIVEVGVSTSVINHNSVILGAVGCPDSTGAGIGVKDVIKSCQIGCNYVYAADSGNAYTGIVESHSQDVMIINNDIYNANLQIRFNAPVTTGNNLYLNNLHSGAIGIETTSCPLPSMGTAASGTNNTFNNIGCRTIAPSTTYFYLNPPLNPGSCFNHANGLSPYSTPPTPCISAPPRPSVLRRDSMLSLANDTSAIDSATIAFLKNTALSKDTFTVVQDTNMLLAKKGVATTLSQNTYLLSDPILSHFNDSLSSASMGQILAIDTAAGSSNSSVDYSTLLNSLNSIVPANNIEANMQTSAAGFLNYKLNHKLSASQLATLRILAQKCPDWDGVGVYEARSILSLYDPPGTEYSDSCGSNRDDEHKVVKKNKTTPPVPDHTFNLYPNPNNGGFTLEYQLEKGQNGVFTIYDMLGDKVASYQLNPNEEKMRIDETSLNNGVYLYNIAVNNSVVKSDKLVIIK